METKKIIADGKEIIFLYAIFVVGILGHLIEPLRNVMIVLTPTTLLLSGVIGVVYSYKGSTNNFVLWAILTYMITFVLEVVGVQTGVIFGEYSYGATLGIKLFDVPLVIGLNWLLVILGSISIARLITDNMVFSSLISAFIALVFDIVLEPVAIRLDYWTWSEGIIPLQNYVAWFSIALLSALAFNYFNVGVRSRISSHYLLVQFVFFVLLWIFL